MVGEQEIIKEITRAAAITHISDAEYSARQMKIANILFFIQNNSLILEAVKKLDERKIGTMLLHSILNRFIQAKSWNAYALDKEVVDNLDFENFVEEIMKELIAKSIVLETDNGEYIFIGLDGLYAST